MPRRPRELRLTPDDVEVWWHRIERAYRARKDYQERWELLKDYYRGHYFSEASNEDRVTVMLHFAAVRQMAANLYFQDPAFNFVGRTEKGIFDAKISQEVYKLERSIIGAERQERDMVDNALKYGTGILLHAWNTEFGIEPAWADKKKRSGSADHFQGSDNPGHEDLSLPQGPWTEYNTDITFGHPWVKSIRPIDFLVDADALTYEEARWAGRRFTRSWSDAIRDSRWDKEARKQLEEAGPTGQSDTFIDEMDSDDWRDDQDYVDSSLSTFYEIWDKSTGTVITISASADIPMEVKPYPFQGKDGPYEILQFFPSDDSFWAIPYMDTFTSEALAVNGTLTELYDHNQRWSKTRGGYDPDKIDEEDMNRLKETKDGEFVPVRVEEGEKVADALHVLPQPPIPQDHFRVVDIFKNLLQEISGISEIDLGSGKGVQTATEASIIQQQSGLRKGDMRFRVDAALSGSARKTMVLIKQFWNGDQVVPVVGAKGESWNQPVTQSILNGEYDVDIEAGSTEKVDRNARFRQLTEMFRELVAAQPILAQQGLGVDLGEVIKSMIRETNVIKNPDRIIFRLPPQPPPVPGQPGAGQGSPQPALANVTPQDRIPQATDAFQSGRGLSETQGALN